MPDEAGGRLILIRFVASDRDGNPLTFSARLVSGPGTFSLDNASTGAYTFTPSQTDGSEAVVEFTATDGMLTSNKAAGGGKRDIPNYC